MAGVRELLIDAAVGETRTALIEEGRVAEIMLERWSESGAFAPAGVRYRGRVTAVDSARGGAFVDLGVGPPAWLPLGRDARGLSEGAAAEVRVRAEAHAEKGPILALETVAEPGAPAPELLSGDSSWGARFGVEDVESRQAEIADRADIDAAVEAALSPHAAIPGGGVLWIETTRALTAVDVDSAGRAMKGDPARATRALIQDAAAEIAFQARLRGLGGLIVIDLPAVPRSARKEAAAAVERAFAGDVRQVESSPISRFGVMQVARERAERPLADILLDADGRLSVESAALAGLRALEREGAANRSARLALRAAPEVAKWLKADTIGWRAAMTERIGPRFELESDPERPRESPDVAVR